MSETKRLNIKTINTINMLLAQTEQDILRITGQDITLIVVPKTKVEGNTEDVHKMVRVIATTLKMLPSDVSSKSRYREYVHLRTLIAYFAKVYYPELTLKEIAKLFGSDDHALVLYYLRNANDWIDNRESRFIKKYEKVLYAVTQFFSE